MLEKTNYLTNKKETTKKLIGISKHSSRIALYVNSQNSTINTDWAQRCLDKKQKQNKTNIKKKMRDSILPYYWL